MVEVKKQVSCRLVVGGEELKVVLYILPSIPTDITIGVATQKLLKSTVDKSRKKLIRTNASDPGFIRIQIGKKSASGSVKKPS